MTAQDHTSPISKFAIYGLHVFKKISERPKTGLKITKASFPIANQD